MNKDGFVILDKVSKFFDNFPALQDVSFSIDEGEIFGYIGPNGAGKTTTIKILVGLISKFQGNLMIDGKSMPDHKNDVHKILGYLPQDVAFQDWRTVDHALTTFGELSGMDKTIIDDRIEEVLKLVKIPDSRNKKIKELSGGTIQKVGLAQALLHNPKLLVFDEPLAGLDPASRYQVKEIIKELSKGETTVFFSSHILSDVQDVASKIGILNRGRILDIGDMEELKREMSAPEVVSFEFTEDFDDINTIENIKKVDKVEKILPNKIKVFIDSRANIDNVSHSILKQILKSGYRIRSFGPETPNLDQLYIKYVQEEG